MVYIFLFCHTFVPKPSLCYYRWLPIAAGKSGTLVEQGLLDKGIRVYHSDRFAVSAKEKGSAYLRVSLCSAGNSQRLKKGLTILKDYIFDRESLTQRIA